MSSSPSACRFIVITPNEERELPPAFVRRCVVLNLNPPDPVKEPQKYKDDAFANWLVAPGRVHRHLVIADAARKHAADQVLDDRKEVAKAGYPPVGLAEYIDLLTAVHELTRESPEEERAAAQISWLQRLSVYALVKSADAMQDRPPREVSVTPTADAVNERP